MALLGSGTAPGTGRARALPSEVRGWGASAPASGHRASAPPPRIPAVSRAVFGSGGASRVSPARPSFSTTDKTAAPRPESDAWSSEDVTMETRQQREAVLRGGEGGTVFELPAPPPATSQPGRRGQSPDPGSTRRQGARPLPWKPRPGPVDATSLSGRRRQSGLLPTPAGAPRPPRAQRLASRGRAPEAPPRPLSQLAPGGWGGTGGAGSGDG